jgi:hypothetical protein
MQQQTTNCLTSWHINPPPLYHPLQQIALNWLHKCGYVQASSLSNDEKIRVRGKILDASRETYENIYHARMSENDDSFAKTLQGYISMTIDPCYLVLISYRE